MSKKSVVTKFRKNLRPSQAELMRFEILLERLDGITDELYDAVQGGDLVELEEIDSAIVDGLLGPMGAAGDKYTEGVAKILGDSILALFISNNETIEIFRQSFIDHVTELYDPRDAEHDGVSDGRKMKSAIELVNQFVDGMKKALK